MMRRSIPMKRIKVQETEEAVRLVLDETPIAEALGTQTQKRERAGELADRWNRVSKEVDAAFNRGYAEALAFGYE